MKHEKIYLVTDGCAWEINKATGNEHPHSIEVADLETGAIRYIRSGSRISFIEGEITDIRTQKTYNKAIQKKTNSVSSNRQTMQKRTSGKKSRQRNKS